MERLLRAVEDHFDLSCVQEFTVEAGRPDSITKEKLEVLKRHKVTRISINPQTMNQETLDVIGEQAYGGGDKGGLLSGAQSGIPEY